MLLNCCMQTTLKDIKPQNHRSIVFCSFPTMYRSSIQLTRILQTKEQIQRNSYRKNFCNTSHVKTHCLYTWYKKHSNHRHLTLPSVLLHKASLNYIQCALSIPGWLWANKNASTNRNFVTHCNAAEGRMSNRQHAQEIWWSNNAGWLGSRVVSVLDSGAEGPGFKLQPQRCRVTVLGKLFTPIVPLFTKQQNW